MKRLTRFFEKRFRRKYQNERYFEAGLIWLAIFMIVNSVFLVSVIFFFPDWNVTPDDKVDKKIASISLFGGVEDDNFDNSFSKRDLANNCYYYGSFIDVDTANKFKQTIDLKGNISTAQEIGITATPDYMVYINRRLKVSDLKQLLEELRSRSIDGAIVALSSQESVLSLGLFNEVSEAKDQKRKVSELGYPTEIETINRSYKIFSLRVTGPMTTKTNLKMVLNVPCSGVAENL